MCGFNLLGGAVGGGGGGVVDGGGNPAPNGVDLPSVLEGLAKLVAAAKLEVVSAAKLATLLLLPENGNDGGGGCGSSGGGLFPGGVAIIDWEAHNTRKPLALGRALSQLAHSDPTAEFLVRSRAHATTTTTKTYAHSFLACSCAPTRDASTATAASVRQSQAAYPHASWTTNHRKHLHHGRALFSPAGVCAYASFSRRLASKATKMAAAACPPGAWRPCPWVGRSGRSRRSRATAPSPCAARTARPHLWPPRAVAVVRAAVVRAASTWTALQQTAAPLRRQAPPRAHLLWPALRPALRAAWAGRSKWTRRGGTLWRTLPRRPWPHTGQGARAASSPRTTSG